MIKIPNKHRDLKTIAILHYKGVIEGLRRNRNNIDIPNVLKEEIFEDTFLKKIIVSPPPLLLRLELLYETKCRANGINNYNELAQQVVKYDSFSKKSNIKKYDAYELSKLLNVQVCPYCNRGYTFTIEDGDDKIMRPDFDHFFSQSKHPLLALSFYNLIPSCSICNSRLKGSTTFDIKTHVHPYIEQFGNDATFNYVPRDYNASIGASTNMGIDFEFSGKATKVKKIKNNIGDFKLEKIYSGHTPYVAEIVKKFYITNGEYLKALTQAFPKIGTVEELYNLGFSNYYNTEDFEKRPLSKLTYDIVQKLGFE